MKCQLESKSVRSSGVVSVGSSVVGWCEVGRVREVWME